MFAAEKFWQLKCDLQWCRPTYYHLHLSRLRSCFRSWFWPESFNPEICLLICSNVNSSWLLGKRSFFSVKRECCCNRFRQKCSLLREWIKRIKKRASRCCQGINHSCFFHHILIADSDTINKIFQSVFLSNHVLEYFFVSLQCFVFCVLYLYF